VKKKNKSITIDRNRKAIAGIKKHYANAPSIVLDGVSYKPAEVEKILQDPIDHADATSAAKVAFHEAVAAERAVNVKADAVFLALKTRVFGDFKSSAETVGEFGLALPQRRKLTPEEKARAAAKNKATREARHTMGPRKRQEIKGHVPESPPNPPSHS
jgi:hypothetical protein